MIAGASWIGSMVNSGQEYMGLPTQLLLIQINRRLPACPPPTSASGESLIIQPPLVPCATHQTQSVQAGHHVGNQTE